MWVVYDKVNRETFRVCLVVVFVDCVDDVFKVFVFGCFPFAFRECGDVVGCGEEWVGGFVVEGCVPFLWCVIVPVVCGGC